MDAFSASIFLPNALELLTPLLNNFFTKLLIMTPLPLSMHLSTQGTAPLATGQLLSALVATTAVVAESPRQAGTCPGDGHRVVKVGSNSNRSFAVLNLTACVQQPYLTCFLPASITFPLSNFGIFVGHQVTDSPANMIYSTSSFFSNDPFHETGARVGFAIPEGIGATVGVPPDIDSGFGAIGGKHPGGQLSSTTDISVSQSPEGAGSETVGTLEEKDPLQFQLNPLATHTGTDTFVSGRNTRSYYTSPEGEVAEGALNQGLGTGSQWLLTPAPASAHKN